MGAFAALLQSRCGLVPFRPASPSHGGRTAKSAGGPRCDAPICSDAPLHFSLLPFHHNSRRCVRKEAFLVASRSLADQSLNSDPAETRGIMIARIIIGTVAAATMAGSASAADLRPPPA